MYMTPEGAPIPAQQADQLATPVPKHVYRAVPYGWRIVPNYPTAGMLTAAKGYAGVTNEMAFDIYKAMLRSSPKMELL